MLKHYFSLYDNRRSTLFDLKNGTDCCDTLTRNGITATDLGTFVAKLYQQYGWDNSYIVYSRYSKPQYLVGILPLSTSWYWCNDQLVTSISSYNNHGAPVHYDTRSDCGTLLAGVSSQLAAVNFTYAINSKMFDKDVVENIDAILDDLSKTARGMTITILCSIITCVIRGSGVANFFKLYQYSGRKGFLACIVQYRCDFRLNGFAKLVSTPSHFVVTTTLEINILKILFTYA